MIFFFFLSFKHYIYIFFFLINIHTFLFLNVYRLSEKESQIRELKRMNMTYQSKLKANEEEMKDLFAKIDSMIRERNSLRKQLHLNLLFNDSASLTSTSANSLPPMSTTPTATINDNNKLPMTSRYPDNQHHLLLANDEMTTSSSLWDINYRTGFFV